MTLSPELGAALARINALESEVAALRGSRSWRLTAPLRALQARRRAIVHRPGGNLLTDSDLVMGCESLGDNCEFGLMQRQVGVERLGLFRYGGARNTARLTEAVSNGFEGFGTILDLDMYILGHEWIALSLRYGFSFHTGRQVDATHAAIVRQAESIKLLFMAGLLREDLASGHKIFVRRVDEGDTTEGMIRLYRALRRHGPNALLWVVRATPDRPHGTIEHITSDLFLARHGGLADYGAAHLPRSDLWIDLLRRAHAAISARRSRAGRLSITHPFRARRMKGGPN